MTTKTIVAWDGSREAWAALDWAVARESHRDGTIVLVTVVDDLFLRTTLAEESNAIVESAVEQLQAQVARLAVEAPRVHVGTEILRGTPLLVLREYTHPSTLVVLGADDTEGSEGILRSLGGRLLGSAHGPLALIPLTTAAKGRGIVLGTNMATHASKADEFAAGEAELTGEVLITYPADSAEFLIGALTADLVVVAGPAHGILTSLLARAASNVTLTMPCPVVAFGPHATANPGEPPPRAEALFSS